MDLQELLKNVTINVNINVGIDDETVQLLRQLLGSAASHVTITTKKEEHQPISDAPVIENAETPVAEQQEETKTEDVPVQEQVWVSHKPALDIPAIAKAIREYVSLAESGEDVKETSAIMADEISKMSDGRVSVYIMPFGRFHKILPNFRNTPQIQDLYEGRQWNGFVRLNEIENVLYRAFSVEREVVSEEEKDSTSVISGEKRNVNRGSFTYKNNFERVQPGSAEIRIRRQKDSNQLAPMVIDPEIARFLYDSSYTHVKLGAAVSLDKINDKSLNLIFSREEARTRSPRKSKTISRLRPHGFNKNNGQATTFVIGGDEFQASILRHFKMTCNSGQECVFTIQRTGKLNERGVAYRINKKETATV